MIVLTLPFPPSANRIWRQWKGRTLLSRDGRNYRAEVARVVASERVSSFGRRKLALHVTAVMPDRRRRDLDNLLKAANDAMQAARVFEDDSQIVDLHIVHGGVERGAARLVIRLEAA